MNRLQRYLFRNLLIATLYSTAGLTLTIWLSQSLRLIEIVVSAGAPMQMFLWLLLLTVPTFLGIVLPLALVGAILFTYNRLTADSELVVMRAAGVGPFSLAQPAVLLALMVVGVVYTLNVWITPSAHRELVRMEYVVRNDYSQLFLREGVFNEVGDRFSVFLRERDSDGNLHKVLIHDGRDEVKPVTVMGDRAVMLTGPEGTRFVVYDGNRQELDRKTGRLSQLFFERYAVDLKVLTPTAEERWPDARERSTADLFAPEAIAQDDRMRRGLIAELHHRFASPLLALAYAAVALAALLSGEFNRRGQSRRITVAVLLVMGLQAAALGLTSLAGKMTPFVPLMYVLPFCAVIPSIWVMSRGLRLKPSQQAAPGATDSGTRDSAS
ncbi:LPS export ABC transporter permease LptF [Azospirillum griseum]|uniref:LPS export ABC transporter permease LptF n=1 Tax=Azospirillum griseum TaxID=2496639 RepID=A0A431VI36_9PROT|nr:LPS export ABC transporter permease LptF [Azospirillum griseum]RTR21015.1 LPS export ABC transporter permease LptF [Azospirillum griseum]